MSRTPGRTACRPARPAAANMAVGSYMEHLLLVQLGYCLAHPLIQKDPIVNSRILSGCCAILLATALPAPPAAAQGTLRIGMTASDIPLTTGQADQGGEGQRFMALTVYDALVHWDLTSATKPSTLIPGLAASWAPDAKDKTK